MLPDFDKIAIQVIHPEEVLQGKRIVFSHLKEAAMRGVLEFLKNPRTYGPNNSIDQQITQLQQMIQEVRK